MRPTIKMPIQLLALILAAIFTSSAAVAQNAPAVSLAEQLKAQYKLAKLGTDGGGLAVIDPGTVLNIQKGGILGLSPNTAVMCPAKYQNGNMNPPSKFCKLMVKENSRYFQVGEKVYPTKIDVNLDKDKVSFQIVDCDSCNGNQQPTFYKSEVVFQFGKGELKNTSVPQVEDIIAQVFAIDQGGDSSQQAQNSAQGQAPAAEQPSAQTQTIQLEQTTDQVVAAMGQPEKIVNLGPKQIYVYKDLKIMFMNGKVSDVQ